MTDAYIDPDRDLFRKLRALPQDRAVDMLNLVRLRDQAAYEDGRNATGAEAYRAYGEASAAIFERVGGRIVWSAIPEFMVIGPQEERWDVAFVARYPSGQAFLDMVYDQDYQAVVFHRQAAVLTSRLMRMQPRDAGSGFG